MSDARSLGNLFKLAKRRKDETKYFTLPALLAEEREKIKKRKRAERLEKERQAALALARKSCEGVTIITKDGPLKTYPRPHDVVSIPKLEETKERLKIKELDRYLLENEAKGSPQKLLKVTSMPAILNNFYNDRQEYIRQQMIAASQVRVKSPPKILTKREVGPWSLDALLNPEQIAMLPEPQEEVESKRGTFLDALDAYNAALEYAELDKITPPPLFGKTIELQGHELLFTHCQCIVAGLKAGPAVQSFIVKNTSVSDIGFAHLIASVFDHPLEIVDINDIVIGKHSMLALADTKSPMLLELKVTDCGLGNVWDILVNYDRSPIMPQSPGDIPSFSIKNEVPLFQIIGRSLCLQHLDLSKNIFSLRAWEVLCDALEEAIELRTLVLDECGLNMISVELFVQTLDNMMMLQNLSLKHQDLDDETAFGTLLYAISNHTLIAHVNLCGNGAWTANSLGGLLSTGLCLLSCHFLWDPDHEHAERLKQRMGWEDDDAKLGFGDAVAWRVLHVANIQTNWKLGKDDGIVVSDDQTELELFEGGCWLCKKCVSHSIRYIIPNSGPSTTFINLYASWNNWNPVQLPRHSVTRTKLIFAKDFLVPPGSNHLYFFEGTVGLICATDQPSRETPKSVITTFANLSASRIRPFVVPARVNHIVPVPFAIPDGSIEGDVALVRMGPVLFPKLHKQQYVYEKEFLEKQYVFRRCFDHDCRYLDLKRLCKGTNEESLKSILFSRYWNLFEIYTTFQGRSQLKNTLIIKRKEVFEFIEELRIIFIRNGTLAEVDFEELNNLTFTKDGQSFDVLGRHQFLELCIRVAIFIKPELEVEKALIYFCDNIIDKLLVPPLAPFPYHYLYLTEVANLFFDWRNTLRKAHHLYAHNVDGFIALCQALRLYENSFTAKHCASVFALSKKVTISGSKRPFRLTMSEFQETLGRLILVRTCKTEEKKIRRRRTMGIIKLEDEFPPFSRITIDGRVLYGKELFRAAVQAVVNRSPVQIIKNRKNAFFHRMETLLKMIDEKVRVKIG